ncbi:MAG: hypothetical protein LQ338_008222, partial [Usnochroma carphineum]
SNALTTDLVIESVHGSPEEALDTPQLHLQDLNSGGDPVLPSSQILTTLDTILQSSSPQPNTNTVSSTDTASAHQMPGSHQGPIAHHQSTGTGQQHVQPPLAVPHHTAYPRGWNNLKWAYRTHTIADIELQQQGIWLFERPTTFHEHRRLYPMADMALPSHSQVIVAPSSQAQHTSGFLADGQTLVLLPHASSWHPDMRSTGYNDAVVPDSVFTTRLTEYQATEALGYEVWRHDRKHLPCANPVCQMVLSDHGKFTRICLSCGPKSTIRYCSEMCQAADLYRHSQDCGLHRYLIRTTIDDGTAPPRFSHIFPAIRNRHGVRTSVIQRQRLYAQITDGRYTLFDPTNGQPTILVWDYRYIGRQEFPYRGYGAEMEARIERCLNIALFDHTQTMAIEYLFRLLQQCLRIKGASQTVARTLSFQFAQEFNFHAVASWRVAAGLSICECEWSRDDVVPHQHTASCKLRYRGQGEMIRGRQRSLKKLVEAMEARYWILRAWRKQHPTETDWQRRVLGHGFPGCVLPAGWVPRLGKGWVGYWGPEDDICG